MVISHNLSAFNAGRQLGMTSTRKAKSTEKLASGYKINRAADDAAGLTISEKMRAQIRGLNQGTDNIQDGISACQIMDGALSESQEIMHRLTELTVKASNGTLDAQDRQAIQREINELTSELTTTADRARFNTKPLLTTSNIQRPDHALEEALAKADVIFVIDNTGSMGSYVNNVRDNLNSFASGLNGCDVQYGVVEFGDLNTVSGGFMSSPDEVISRLSRIQCLGGGDENEAALEGIMAGADYPFRSDASAKELILVTDAPYHDRNGDGEAYSQLTASEVADTLRDRGIRLSVVTNNRSAGAYSNGLADGPVLDITGNFRDSLASLATNISDAAGAASDDYYKPDDLIIQMSGIRDDTFVLHTYNVTAAELGVDPLDCSDETNARESIDKVNKALSMVSGIRSQVGAQQNALEHAYRIKQNTAENTQAAESQIRDTDMASEMVKNSMENILEQAGQSMLAQANQNRQGILSLLS